MFYWQDFRYAVRLLVRSPLFTLLTVVVLAGGLGLSIFTYSFLHTAMLKPLPLPDGGRVVRLLATEAGNARDIDAADLAAVRRGITTLTEVGAYTGRELVVGTGEGTRTVQATATEWNIFEVTRTRPALGRGFRLDDQAPGAEPVIVLSHWAWQVLFGGDSGVVDRTVPLNGAPTRVIGIMPPGFGFPVASEAWIPIPPALLEATVPGGERVGAYARLADGVEPARADAELTGLLRRVVQDRPAPPAGETLPDGMVVQSFPLAQIGEEAPLVLLVLNTLAILILLLACINVTNLLLARAGERARETAVRLALGAPRVRLIMQSLWESVILCLAGGALATGLAVWGLDAINAWCRAHLEGNLAFWWVWGFDRTVLLSAGAFVTVALVVLGAVVSRRAVNTEINAVLQEGGSRGGARREGRVARALVVTQVATVSLLMFFGCMAAIVAYRVASIDLGYDTRNLLSTGVELPEERYAGGPARSRFYQDVHDRLTGRAEVESAVWRTTLGDLASESGEFELRDRAPGGQPPRTYVMAVLGPLTTLGIPLLEGRAFDTGDRPGSAASVIVSRALAERYWPGRSPIGKELRFTGLGGPGEWRTVVGVVGNVLLGNPLSRNRSAVAAYLPLSQTGSPRAALTFRHRGSAGAAIAALHASLAEVDPLIAPSSVASFDEILAKSTLMAKSVTRLFAACFAFALLLAVSGTYGLMARAIGRRTREIGVRRALGATDRTILLMLLGQGGRQLGIGALVALPLTLLVGWGFAHYFPIAPALAISTAVLVSAAIVLVVLAATWVPTRRAIAVEPRDALWRE